MQPLYITRNIHISFLPRDANQSAVLPRQVVRPSVTLKYRWLEYFYNNFVADYSSLYGVRSLQIPTSRIYSKGIFAQFQVE